MRTRIKICGLTRTEDAKLAGELGADALGFIFVPGTPRYVGDREDLAELLSAAPAYSTPVAVCRGLEDVSAIPPTGFRAVQHYGPVAGGAQEGLEIVWCLRVRDRASLEGARERTEGAKAILLDACSERALGGAGEVFDWALARDAKLEFSLPVILAGGLNPENVGNAIAAVRPYAVDVSSGVESAPGVKDPAMLRAFFQAVRDADRHVYG